MTRLLELHRNSQSVNGLLEAEDPFLEVDSDLLEGEEDLLEDGNDPLGAENGLHPIENGIFLPKNGLCGVENVFMQERRDREDPRSMKNCESNITDLQVNISYHGYYYYRNFIQSTFHHRVFTFIVSI